MQTNNLFLSLAIFSLVFSLLCIVFLCIWIYRDAKGRGQNGAVWILIAVTASPMIGLLAYFLAGRKEIRVPCQSCDWMVSKDARFCERCGTEQVSVPLPPQGKKQGNSFLPASIIYPICNWDGIRFSNRGKFIFRDGLSVSVRQHHEYERSMER